MIYVFQRFQLWSCSPVAVEILLDNLSNSVGCLKVNEELLAYFCIDLIFFFCRSKTSNLLFFSAFCKNRAQLYLSRSQLYPGCSAYFLVSMWADDLCRGPHCWCFALYSPPNISSNKSMFQSGK